MLVERAGVAPEEAYAIAAMAGGSPGQAIALSSGATLDADRLARAWVAANAVDRAEQTSVADGFRGADGQARFETLMERLSAAVQVRAKSMPRGQGARWAELWGRLADLPDRTSGLNLDRGDVLAGALADLARTKAMTT